MSVNLEPVFWQNTLPLMVTVILAVGGACLAGWISNSNLSKRVDDINANLSKRIDDTNANLGKRLDDTNANLGKRMDEANANLGKRMDDMGKRVDEANAGLSMRLDEIITRLGRIEGGSWTTTAAALPSWRSALRRFGASNEHRSKRTGNLQTTGP